MLSGGAGVIGGVNYSISSGMILDTRNASRYPLLAAGAAMIICAALPPVISLIITIPTVITGCLLIFIMTSQLSAALPQSRQSSGPYLQTDLSQEQWQ